MKKNKKLEMKKKDKVINRKKMKKRSYRLLFLKLKKRKKMNKIK